MYVRPFQSFNRLVSLFSLLSFSMLLNACSTGVSAGLETFTLLNPWADPTAGTRLNPDLKYLRVTTNGKPSLFVLGYVDPVSGSDNVDEVWYSRAGELLRIRNGRVVSLLGVPGELKSVTFDNLPDDWSRKLNAATYTRTRNLAAPGSYGLTESVELHRLNSASPSQWKQSPVAQVYSPDDLLWFEERYVAQSGLARPASPSLYGVLVRGDSSRVVYSEQCPTPQYCISLQEWSVQ